MSQSKSERDFYSRYEVNFEAMTPDENLSPTQRRLIEFTARFTIFVLQDFNKKMERTCDAIDEIDGSWLAEDCQDDLENLEKFLNELHASYFRLYKFCEHLIETYLGPDQNPEMVLEELKSKAPLEVDDGIDSDDSCFNDSDFEGAADTEDEVDEYLADFYSDA